MHVWLVRTYAYVIPAVFDVESYSGHICRADAKARSSVSQLLERIHRVRIQLATKTPPAIGWDQIEQVHKANGRIDAPLSHFYLADDRRGASQVTIIIEELPDKVPITVEDERAWVSVEECRQARCFLNAPLRSGLQDYYVGLAGEESVWPVSPVNPAHAC